MKRLWTRRTALMVAVGLLLGPPDGSRAVAGQADQVWLVSTRAAPYCRPDPAALGRLRLWERAGDGGWVARDFSRLASPDDPAIPTTFFIHGNRSDRCNAVREGLGVYRCLAGASGRPPLRLVIWSWPADRVSRRPRRDLQIKAARSDVQGYYLAECLRRMAPECPVNLVGYSYGARVITAALQMLAGGRVAGLQLEPSPAVGPSRLRAVLVAAALNNDWLLPGRRNGSALRRVDHLLVTRNGCDATLQWYRLLYHRGGPRALGLTGPVCPGRLGPDRRKIELMDVACSVGKNHGWDFYFASPRLRARLGWYGFLEPDRGRQ